MKEVKIEMHARLRVTRINGEDDILSDDVTIGTSPPFPACYVKLFLSNTEKENWERGK